MAYRIALLTLKSGVDSAQPLERLTQEMPEVEEVEIDPIGHTIRLILDTERADIRSIAEKLRQYGYPVSAPIVTEGNL